MILKCLALFGFISALIMLPAFASGDAVSTPPEGHRAPSKIKREYYVFKTNMDTKLKEVDRDIKELEAKAKSKSAEVRSDVDSRLNELKKLRSDINSELKEMSETTRDQYAKFRSTIQSKYEELSTKTKETINKVTE